MSRQVPQFSRPVEYDPSLALSSANGAHSKAEVLKDEFGFEDDSDGGGHSEASDGDDEIVSRQQRGGGGGGGGGGAKSRSNAAAAEAAIAELEATHQEEMDRLGDALAEAQEKAARAEELSRRTEERLEELSAMSKQAKNILVAKFRQQLKVLMAQVEEQKSMLAEDDETLESLRASNLKMEAGDSAGAAEIIREKMKEFKESRVLTRENTTLRYKVEELLEALRASKEEADEARATAEKAEAKIKSADGDDLATMQTRVEQLETERQMFREDIKKRHIERTKLVAQIADLTANGGGGNASASPTPAAAAAPAQVEAGGMSAAAAAAAAAETAKLQAKIKQLETSLLAANKATAAANAAATTATANAAAAVAAASAAASAAPVTPSGPTAASVAAAAAVAAAEASAASSAAAAAAAAREADLTASIQTLDELLKRREGEMNEVKEKAKEKLTTASNAIKKLKTEYATLRAAYQKIKEEGAVTPAALQARAEQSARLVRRKEILAGMLKHTKASRASLNTMRNDLFAMSGDIPALGSAIASAVAGFVAGRANETNHLTAALKKEMTLRRQLFNQIQELKGNIRVYCRVRPLNQREKEDPNNMTVITHPAEGEMAIQNFEKKTTHTFEFEKIFDSTKKQTDVFAEISDLVISVLDGFNTCIFAYGQTGSGKTYTMQGPKEDPGVNIRALTKLFEVAAERFPDVKYDIKVTLLEIYNEKIQDLLGEKGRTLKAVQGQYGMEVQDLTMASVANESEVLETLKRGSKNRTVVATAMNDVSSRSHLILSVYVMAKNTITGKDTMGKLHLIDLAGSERVGRSGVTGDGMKEAQAINQSLSALGNVISARANKSAHVPYRDSTLTYLLQDSLEKNSKTLMFVQVSPVKNDSSESICSLRFAERVRKVELGKVEAVKKK